MSPLDKLERSLGRLALPRLSLYLVVGQVVVYLLAMLGRLSLGSLVLLPVLVLNGEVWRLASFVLIPPPVSLIFIAFAWWLFYLMGNALEAYWGAFRYNVFLLVGYVFTVGLGFLRPFEPVSNGFLGGSVFLAFAYLNPEFELAIFLVLPIKIRWLAVVAWAGYFVSFLVGSWSTRLQVLAAVANFLLFFGRDIWRRAGLHRRQMTESAQRFGRSSAEREPLHRCRICGRTDLSDPGLDFRYCSKCADDSCYCSEHIFNHEHVLSADSARHP